jgi:hypothetical protein
MKTKLLLCLIAGFASAHAANYVGDQTFAAPFTLNENVNIVGSLTLATPGTYSATSWNIAGVVRFAAPGEYAFVATGGGVAASSTVVGPASGTAIVHVSYRTTVNVVGTLPANVILIDDAQTVSPPPPTQTVSPPPPAPLMNLSVRANLAAGGTVNPGFVIGGSSARRVLVRAVGPGLAAFGVTGVMSDPRLTVFSGSLPAGANDDWGGGAELTATFAAVGAFGVPSASKDAAIVLTLQPGAYTIAVRGSGANDGGEVLVEVYFVE